MGGHRGQFLRFVLWCAAGSVLRVGAAVGLASPFVVYCHVVSDMDTRA
jgi:hypothetical protein